MLKTLVVKKISMTIVQELRKPNLERQLSIFELSALQSVPLVGQIEVDESYFGQRIIRGKVRMNLRKAIAI